jgi:hypothetical protein
MAKKAANSKTRKSASRAGRPAKQKRTVPKKVGRANTYLTEPHPEMPAPGRNL